MSWPTCRDVANSMRPSGRQQLLQAGSGHPDTQHEGKRAATLFRPERPSATIRDHDLATSPPSLLSLWKRVSRLDKQTDVGAKKTVTGRPVEPATGRPVTVWTSAVLSYAI